MQGQQFPNSVNAKQAALPLQTSPGVKFLIKFDLGVPKNGFSYKMGPVPVFLII